MEIQNSSPSVNTSTNDTSVFSESPYTTVEILLIILVAGSLSLITIIGNILVMLSIKVWDSSFSVCLFLSLVNYNPSFDLKKYTQTASWLLACGFCNFRVGATHTPHKSPFALCRLESRHSHFCADYGLAES